MPTLISAAIFSTYQKTLYHELKVNHSPKSTQEIWPFQSSIIFSLCDTLFRVLEAHVFSPHKTLNTFNLLANIYAVVND